MTKSTDYILKIKTAELGETSHFIINYIEENCTQKRFDRLFNAAFSFYKKIEASYISLLNNPHITTRTLMEWYKNEELCIGWHELIISNLEQRKSSKRIQKFLLMSQDERESYSLKLCRENLIDNFRLLCRRISYHFTDSYLCRKLKERFYESCISCKEKLWSDIVWGTMYFAYEDITSYEIQDMLDYCIGVVEEMSNNYSIFAISEFAHSGRNIEKVFCHLYSLRGNLTWIFNRLIYLRPYVKPEHVKLLYNTYSPYSYDIEYAVQGLAYFGKTDMECRKLAYEGLEKFGSPILRQPTIENMKDWYGDFPSDLYKKYTKEYNEFTGVNIPY